MLRYSPQAIKNNKQTDELKFNMNINNLRGDIIEHAPIGEKSWFRCGGRADLLFKPADIDDLAAFLELWPVTQPLMVIGGLANTIVRDGGVRGAVIQLGKPFANVCALNDTHIEAGTGALNGTVAATAVKAGIGGLEFLSGIPGSLGGALRMNAGAYSAEMKDVILGVTAMDRKGKIHRMLLDDMHMSYRHSGAPHDYIFLSAILKGDKEDYTTVKQRITDIKTKRTESQPIKEKTGGSTYANPSAHALRAAGLPENTRAWQIVEMVGGRGLKIGGAQMSEKHCNFMINTGNATASDLENLGDEIKKRAKMQLGLELKWEIKRIGEKP